MRFISTRGKSREASLKEALFRGLAPDGGLYVPRSLPRFSREELAELPGATWQEMAQAVAGRILLGALDPGVTRRIIRESLDFPLPLKAISRRTQVLELFHGPTLAFKDVGARFMARLMAFFREEDPSPLTILTATSGDTGGAVAQAFLGLPGIRVVVLFPDGKVTPRQERQFSTLGRNVHALGVQGDFDDCQRMVKDVFRDQGLRREIRLTSANSINVGRLIPQTLYYFLAWARVREAPGREPPSILFTVPSGNFGNLAAGLMARAMGLPGIRFLAATNANDRISGYLERGHFQPRPSISTLSTAMDVGNPSNLARILHLYGEDLTLLRRDLTSRRVTDQETLDTIGRVHREHGYLLDPHTAVGYHAMEKELASETEALGVLLATAHPAKFSEVVEPVLDQEVPIPAELARCMNQERVVTEMEPEAAALRRFLLHL